MNHAIQDQRSGEFETTDRDSRFLMPIRSSHPTGFQPHSGVIGIGMAIIVATVWLGVWLGAGPTGIVIATAASCFLVATVLVISDMLRWENAESVYEKERSSAEVWNARCIKNRCEPMPCYLT